MLATDEKTVQEPPKAGTLMCQDADGQFVCVGFTALNFLLISSTQPFESVDVV